MSSEATLGLVISPTGQVLLQICSAYKTHHVPILDRHHVVPDSWWVRAGKNPNLSTFADLCPDCHVATHVAIDGLLAGRDVSLIPPRCIALARAAFAGATANGLTPAPTL